LLTNHLAGTSKPVILTNQLAGTSKPVFLTNHLAGTSKPNKTETKREHTNMQRTINEIY